MVRRGLKKKVDEKPDLNSDRRGETLDSIPHKNWEPHVFKRKPQAPALHELLQKPSLLEITPTEKWPIGWRAASTSGEFKTLFPVYQLKGDFSSITVLLCPQCGHILRALGKGIPIVCLECGFPSTEHGWKREDDG
jgi:hypothetical protein